MPIRFFNDGQELVFEDMNAIPVALQRELYDRVVYEMIQRKTDAFFGDSFLVEFATPTSVTVRAGTGFQEDTSQASPEPEKRLLYKATQSSHNISMPDASLDRIDILVVQAAVVDEITATRKFKDAVLETVSNQNLVVQRDWAATVQIVAGTPNASPVAPAVPTGFIKVAEFLVTTVTGISGAGAITDSRSILPIAGSLLINTNAAVRLTQGAEESLEDIILEIDNFLKFGYQEYIDMEDLVADPAAPAAGRLRFYLKNGVGFLRETGGSISPFGAGGGGGGGFLWNEPDGDAPVSEEENGEKVYLFEAGESNKLVAWVKVPQGFVAGRPISLFAAHYSPSAVNTH